MSESSILEHRILKNLPIHRLEPEGSIPCSQEPPTGPYPKPYQSNPSHPISLRSIIILSNHLHLGLLSGLFPSGFPTNILHSIPLLPHSCYTPHLLTYCKYNFFCETHNFLQLFVSCLYLYSCLIISWNWRTTKVSKQSTSVRLKVT
jgi:hypothetical protein